MKFLLMTWQRKIRNNFYKPMTMRASQYTVNAQYAKYAVWMVNEFLLYYKVKMIRPIHPYNRNTYTCKERFDIQTAQWVRNET